MSTTMKLTFGASGAEAERLIAQHVALAELDEAPVRRQHLEARSQERSGERVQDDVDRAHRVLHRVDEARAPRVEDVPDAERAEVVALVVAAGGGDDLGAAPAGDLHGGEADAAGGGVDQHPLPGLQSRLVDQRVVGGDERERDAGRRERRQARRQRRRLAGRAW